MARKDTEGGSLTVTPNARGKARANARGKARANARGKARANARGKARAHGRTAKAGVTKVEPGQLKLLGVPQRPPKNGSWHGGRREGAGRKPKNGVRAGVPHRRRERQTPDVPLHVTLRLVDGLPRLRTRRMYQLVQRAMALTNRFEDVRLCHMSMQHNHLHVILEADDERALSRAMKSFKVCFAKSLNRELGRTGTVFADRYHVERLETPAQVKNALAYVLGNWRKHGEDRAVAGLPRRTDRFSTGPYFDGWDTGPPPQVFFRKDLPFPEDGPFPIRFATSWLLTKGWKRHGLISPWHRPGPRKPAPTAPQRRR
jgi:REP element-mobilizing transposase RayT